MIEKGLYYANSDLQKLIRSVGGIWNDTKQRPIVCLIKSSDDPDLYWAIPMGNYDHRTEEQKKRLDHYLNLPEKDIRSCYYHLGRTTAQSIFFISDAIPITDKYIYKVYLGKNQRHFIIKNQALIKELERKLYRILRQERLNPNCYRQRITDVKNEMLMELKAARAAKGVI